MPHYLKATACAIYLLLSSTRAEAQTTQEEYDFCTKGYALVQNAGMDMKAGYTLQPGMEENVLGRNMQLHYLTRKDGTTAAILLIHTKPDGSRLYLGIPDRRSDLSIRTQALGAFRGYFGLWYQSCHDEGAWAELTFLYHALESTVGYYRIPRY